MDGGVNNLPSGNWRADWEKCQPYIEDALEHSPAGDNIYDVLSVLERGAGWLWPREYSAGVTLLEGDVYTIWLYGGSLEDLKTMLKNMVEHATRLKVSKVVVYGRKGWARKLLPEHGFQTAYVIMEKPLR